MVDTSVWIDHFNGVQPPHVKKLHEIIISQHAVLVVGDLVLCEVLQGLRSTAEAQLIEAALRKLLVLPLVGVGFAVRAAANYRLLRSRGVTIRKTPDLLIGTFCIEERLSLLHHDRDFDQMAQHLDLSIVAY